MAESFNIDRFMEGSGKVDLSDINWAEVPRHPMTPEALRTLRYFMITESSTFLYAKALMQTPTVMLEPDFAPFLCVWMYEEEFHGRAFRKFVESYGEPVQNSYRSDFFRRRTLGEHIDELGQVVLSRLFEQNFPAVHMIWGAIQEFTTYCAYQALIERINHPVLNVICRRIMKQELRHFAFYREQAKRRLTKSRAAQLLTRGALKLAWTPVGDGMSPSEETRHAIRFLFDGRDGTVAEKIDQKMRELPGLEWFDLFTRYVVDHDIRRAPPSWFTRPEPGAESAHIAA